MRTEKGYHLVNFIVGIQLIVSNAHQRKAPFVMRYARTTNNYTMTIIAIGLLILAGLGLMFYMVGSQGRLMFRPHMTEDWVIWGIAVISTATSIFLFAKRPKKS